MKTTKRSIINTAMKTIAEADVMSGRMDAHLYQTSPTYKKEWERCNLIDLQVFIEIECENKKKPNKALYNTDATYTKTWDKRSFERIKQNFERKYAKLWQ